MSFVSYAQNFEDVILWRALKHVENGFYIDIGAQHPVVDSVSRAFYEQGWRGVHVEPTQQYADLLRAERPDETVFQLAIGNQSQRLKFYEFEDTGLSTADSEVARRHQESGFKCRETIVPILSLDALLQQVAAHDIHWLKVDVEGLEKEVLGSWSSDANLPWVVVVESTRPMTQEKCHEEWEFLLSEKGYIYVYFDGLNRFYVSPEHAELIEAFGSPPNIFDEFALSGTASQPFYSLVASRAQRAEATLQVSEEQRLQAEARAESSEARAEQVEQDCRQAESRAQQAEAQYRQVELQRQQAEMQYQHAELEAQQAKAQSEQAITQCRQAEARAQHVESALSAIHKSTSWRITAPMRWVGFQLHLLRTYGVKGRGKAGVRKFVVPVLHKTVAFVSARPELRTRLVALSKKTGTYDALRQAIYRLQRTSAASHRPVARGVSEQLPLAQQQLTPRGRKIYAGIKAAMERNVEHG